MKPMNGDLNPNNLKTDGGYFIDSTIDRSRPKTCTNGSVVVTSTSMMSNFSDINLESISSDSNKATDSTSQGNETDDSASRDNKTDDSTSRDNKTGDSASRDNKADDSASRDNEIGDSASRDNKTHDSASQDNEVDGLACQGNKTDHSSVDSTLANTSNVSVIDTASSNTVNHHNAVSVMNVDDNNSLSNDAIVSDVSRGGDVLCGNISPVNKISSDIAEASTSLYSSDGVEITDNGLPRGSTTAVEENSSHDCNSESLVNDHAETDEIPRKRAKIDSHVTTNIAATFPIDQQRSVSVNSVDRIDANDTIMDDRLVIRAGDSDAIMNDHSDSVDRADNHNTDIDDHRGDLVNYQATTSCDILSDVTPKNATDSNMTNDSDAKEFEPDDLVTMDTVDKSESITDRVEPSFGFCETQRPSNVENSVDFTLSGGDASCQQVLTNDNSVLSSRICANESATTSEVAANVADWQKYQEHGGNRCEAKSVDHDELFERQENSTVNDDFEDEINKSDNVDAGDVKCLRKGCTNIAVDNAEWEHEYCSNECVIMHTKDVFEYWKRNYQAQLKDNMKSS